MSLLALAALSTTAPPSVQSVPTLPIAVAEQPPLPPSSLAFGSIESRMTVPVSIGERGPYRFIVDTGAERTVVSHDLAGLLGLEAGGVIRVTAMTNSANVGTVRVPSLRISRIAAETIDAPALDQANMGAPGMLGIDALQGHAVSIDFDQRLMTITPSRRRHAPSPGPDEIVVTARNLFGQLIVTDARFHGHRVAVVVDTGTPVSIVNAAFVKLMGKAPRTLGTVDLISALGQETIAPLVVADRVEIGGVAFNNMPLAQIEAEPFRRFDLVDEPALLLGMDALRLFRQVRIDFANREIRFSMPVAAAVQAG
ncbi:MAG: retropepsin-like aspartic protease [Sphingomonas sp.]